MMPKSAHHFPIPEDDDGIDKTMRCVRQYIGQAYSVKIWFHGEQAALKLRDGKQRFVNPNAIRESGDWLSLNVIGMSQLSKGTHRITVGDKRGKLTFIFTNLSAQMGMHFTVESLS